MDLQTTFLHETTKFLTTTSPTGRYWCFFVGRQFFHRKKVWRPEVDGFAHAFVCPVLFDFRKKNMKKSYKNQPFFVCVCVFYFDGSSIARGFVCFFFTNFGGRILVRSGFTSLACLGRSFSLIFRPSATV